MTLVEIQKEKLTVSDPRRGEKTLLRGMTYLMEDAAARRIVDCSWGRIATAAPAWRRLTPGDCTYHEAPVKTLFLVGGGLGDAVSTAVLFSLLEKKHRFHIDVGCSATLWHDVFVPMGVTGRRIDCPVDGDTLNAYDVIQDDVTAFITDTSRKWERSIVEELTRSYNVPLNEFDGEYTIPDDVTRTMALPKGPRPRIALCPNSAGTVRSYPDDLMTPLIGALVDHGFAVYLLGPDEPAARHGRGHCHDYRGGTTVPEMAALLSHMDLVVGVDSFPIHLANILGVRSLVFLSTTRSGIYRRHRHVHCRESAIACTPCGAVHNDCPRGYESCRAFYHDSMSLERIFPHIITAVSAALSDRMTSRGQVRRCFH